MSHTESVSPSSCASSGRAGSPPDAFLPVKTLGGVQMLGERWRSTVHERTSITATPKAKTSSSCVIEFGLSRFSSVARVTSYPFPCLVGFTRQNIEENSTTDKRAWPSRSMRMLSYSRVISEAYAGIKKVLAPFRVPWIV